MAASNKQPAGLHQPLHCSAATQPYALKQATSAGRLPRHWTPQENNTELVEVNLESPEVAELVQATQQEAKVQVVKVSSTFNAQGLTFEGSGKAADCPQSVTPCGSTVPVTGAAMLLMSDARLRAAILTSQ